LNPALEAPIPVLFGPGLRFFDAAVGPPPVPPVPGVFGGPDPELLPLRLRRLLAGLCDSA